MLLKELSDKNQIHHKIYNDNKDYEYIVHCIKVLDFELVNGCKKGIDLSGINHLIKRIKEQKYLMWLHEI